VSRCETPQAVACGGGATPGAKKQILRACGNPHPVVPRNGRHRARRIAI